MPHMADVPEGSTKKGQSHFRAISLENLKKSNLKVKKRYGTETELCLLVFQHQQLQSQTLVFDLIVFLFKPFGHDLSPCSWHQGVCQQPVRYWSSCSPKAYPNVLWIRWAQSTFKEQQGDGSWRDWTTWRKQDYYYYGRIRPCNVTLSPPPRAQRVLHATIKGLTASAVSQLIPRPLVWLCPMSTWTRPWTQNSPISYCAGVRE